MNETVTIAFIVLVAVLVSLVGLALVRRLVPAGATYRRCRVCLRGHWRDLRGDSGLRCHRGVGRVPGRPGGGCWPGERGAQPGPVGERMAHW